MAQLTSQQLASAQDTNAVIARQMPEFYRKFLDDNYKLHRDYNRSLLSSEEM
jgi:Apoptogenic protein 1